MSISVTAGNSSLAWGKSSMQFRKNVLEANQNLMNPLRRQLPQFTSIRIILNLGEVSTSWFVNSGAVHPQEDSSAKSIIQIYVFSHQSVKVMHLLICPTDQCFIADMQSEKTRGEKLGRAKEKDHFCFPNKACL